MVAMGKKTWAERQADEDPVQFEAELLDAIRIERFAVAHHETQADCHRRQLAELEKLADEHEPRIPYPPRNEPPSPMHTSRGIRNEHAAKRVSAYIKQHGLSRVGFASRAGISVRTLQTVLRECIAEHETWARIAEAMDKMKLDDLLRLY